MATETKPELRPYYKGPFATLYHGDCRDILPRITDRADLIVSDPPYGIAYEAPPPAERQRLRPNRRRRREP